MGSGSGLMPSGTEIRTLIYLKPDHGPFMALIGDNKLSSIAHNPGCMRLNVINTFGPKQTMSSILPMIFCNVFS